MLLDIGSCLEPILMDVDRRRPGHDREKKSYQGETDNLLSFLPPGEDYGISAFNILI